MNECETTLDMRMSRSASEGEKPLDASEGERPLDVCKPIDLELRIALHVQRVMSHVLMSHVSRINVCRIKE